MLRNFTKGMIIGGIIGASVSVLANPDVVDPRTRRRMIKSGRKMLRKSSVLGDVMEMLR